MQSAWRSCGCSVPGRVQGQVGFGPGQSDLMLYTEVGNPDLPAVNKLL